jgi:hypothetical protein
VSPLLLAVLLLAGLLALLPVWRLHVAGWRPRWLLAAWIGYAVAIAVLVRFPIGGRFLLPILVLAVLAPFVAGPERLRRILGGGRREPGVVIDVTPLIRPALPEPRAPADDGADDDRDTTDGGAGA